MDAYKAERQVIRNFDEVMPKLEEFRAALRSLSVLVLINSNLVEIIGISNLARARELALELYAFDSRNMRYREVAGCDLQAVRTGSRCARRN